MIERAFACHMRACRRAALCCAIGVALGGPLWSPAATAEIYRWVDEEGKVHFGDRPLNPEAAAAASPVEIREAYRPTERSEEEARAFREEQERIFDYQIERAARERADRERERASRRDQLEEICARHAEDLRKFTTPTIGADGRLVRHYIEEDGKSVSEQRQRELLQGLKDEMERMGCN
tara:strand:+ start:3638 stop:4174 length:537 start_codon:yes stop_codon:yes gene_type:complete